MTATRLPITVISAADEATLRRFRSNIQHAAWVLHDPTLLEANFAATACACCRAGASMTASFLDLFRKRTQAEVPPFERIIVTAAAGQAGDALIELNRSAAANAACRVTAVTTWAEGEDAWIADHWMGGVSAGVESLELNGRHWSESLGPAEALRARDDQSIEDFVLGWPHAQALEAIGAWLHTLTDSLGARLLRVHGEAHTPHGVYAIEARSHALAPPAPIDFPRAPGTRLRFVTLGLEPADLSPGWPVSAARTVHPDARALAQPAAFLEVTS